MTRRVVLRRPARVGYDDAGDWLEATAMQTVTRGGKQFVMVPVEAWQRLVSGETDLPPLPAADAAGNMPAVDFARAAIARRVIMDRTAAGWSQTEFARRSGVRVETSNRIERAKVTADVATLTRIDRAIRAAGGEPAAGDKPRRTDRVSRRDGRRAAAIN